MGIIGSLLNALFNAATTVSDEMDHRSDNFSTGYDHGAKRASQMSDAELRASLKRAKENGVSDWKSAGSVRAMADEYKNRK